MLFWTVCADVACRPQGLARQHEVNPFVTMNDAMRRCTTDRHLTFGRRAATIRSATCDDATAIAFGNHPSSAIHLSHRGIAALPDDSPIVGLRRKHSGGENLCLVKPEAQVKRKRDALDKQKLTAYGADGESEVAVGVTAHIDVVRVEEHVACTVTVVLVERTRPVHTVCAAAIEIRAGVVLGAEAAGSRQEDAVAVHPARHFQAIDSVQRRLLVCCEVHVQQFLHLFLSRCLPLAAPVDGCSIIFRLEGRQIVHHAVAAIRAVLFHCILRTAAESVNAPIVDILCLRLAPGKVVAILLRAVGADIACCPKRAAGQPEVNPLVACFIFRKSNVCHLRYLIHMGLIVFQTDCHILCPTRLNAC